MPLLSPECDTAGSNRCLLPWKCSIQLLKKTFQVYGIFDEVWYMIAITTTMSPDNMPPSILHTTLNLKWGGGLHSNIQLVSICPHKRVDAGEIKR